MENLSTFHQIIVLINGKIVHNSELKKTIDNVVLLHKNKYLNTKLVSYVAHLRDIYFRTPNNQAIDYLESEILKELAPNKKLNKIVNKMNTVNGLKDKLNKLKGNNKIETINPEKLFPVNPITYKKKLSYKDIKPYLTAKQLRLIKDTTTKRNVKYETKTLTYDEKYYNKQLEIIQKDFTKKILSNKHINTSIGTVYRIFTEK